MVWSTYKTGQGDDPGLAKEKSGIVAGGLEIPFFLIINVFQDVSGEDGYR